ncbi:MAG: NYN domain-containing protein [Flavipsychrobacter sp.]
MNNTQDLRFAVLIDADNVPASGVKEIMEEIAKYGTPTYKRIYSDWTRPHMNSWKEVLLDNAITPIQQYSYTKGKNATDSAMIIDAMDILYSKRVDGFCIVSSDSDFTRLALRLREAGMKVIGIGEKKTPSPFIAACEKFIYLEILKQDALEAKDNADTIKQEKESIQKIDQKLIRTFTNAINDLAEEDGWAYLGDVGNLINKKKPDFDPRNYGFNKLGLLMKSISNFEIDERQDKGNIKLIYLRLKPRPKSKKKIAKKKA